MIVTYDMKTGESTGVLHVEGGEREIIVPPGEGWVEAPDGTPLPGYVDRGVYVPRPAQPTPFHRWDISTHAWLLDLEDLRKQAWERIKADRDAAEAAGFDTPWGRFDSDPASQTKIIGAAQLASIALAQGAPFNIEWTLQDNTSVSLDAAQMIAVGAALANHVNAIHQRGRQLRAQIEAAATLADLESITWTL